MNNIETLRREVRELRRSLLMLYILVALEMVAIVSLANKVYQ